MKKGLVIIFAISGLFYACNSGKYVNGFKNIKKNIDTLEVLPIDVQIRSIDFLYKTKSDSQLEAMVKPEILNQIKSILGKKYVIKISDSNAIKDSQFFQTLNKYAMNLTNKRIL